MLSCDETHCLGLLLLLQFKRNTIFSFVSFPTHSSLTSHSRQHLERITSVGPRPVGSPENEVLTVGYLLEQIESIRVETATGPHQLTVDVQRPTGSFSIDFLGGFTSFYDHVTNIAVRLEPKGGSQNLMLANCHFDTVANSPGKSSFHFKLNIHNFFSRLDTVLQIDQNHIHNNSLFFRSNRQQ